MRKYVVSRFLLVVLAVLFVSALTGYRAVHAANSSQKDSQKPVTISIWCWDNSAIAWKTYDAYRAKHPNINFAITTVKREDMLQKLQIALASGTDLPDIAWCEATFRGSLLALDIWEDISKKPYNFNKNQILNYLIPLETTPSGVYAGPEVPSVGGMAYKRPLAKQYFGTDDPAKLQKLFTSWDKFISEGIKVKKASDGKVFMLGSLWDAMIFFQSQSNTPFVIGDQLNLKKSVTPLLERIIQLKKAGIVDTFEANSPALNASYADSTHIFYPCANWSVTFTVKANDKNGSGRWAFMIPPGGPFSMGGTIQAVPKGAKNKKEAVDFIKFRYQSVEGAQLLRDFQEYFSPYKGVYKDPSFYSKVDPYFGGQDVQKIFARDVLPHIKPVRMATKYDQQINDAINLAIKTINASDGTNISVGNLINQMEDDLVNKMPALKKD